MILRGAQADAFLRKPPQGHPGALLYGGDAMRVALKRQDLIRALAGPEAESEMRLTRMEAATLRDDPAAPLDALKEVGFFPGPRVVHVDGVAENQSKPVLAALDGWRSGDAALVVTAGALKKTSKLRKAFEAHKQAVCLAFYDDPPSRGDVDAAMAAEGLDPTSDARRHIDALALSLDPGAFRQLVAKLATYVGDGACDADAVAAVAPLDTEAYIDDVVLAAADGQSGAIGAILRRLAAQGTNPVTLAILTTRHFQILHGLACGTGQAWGPNRDAMQRQARSWGNARLDAALKLLMDTDLTLRSGSAAPQMAVMERALIRLARMAGARD
ncbi:DNA polymerase III subunit delta [Jannaschia sp. LMIT008]|uniref:DNA polymerase III subunit delta n=1 Tax=Jannaschia maritima TaxID=3032585 RepID=UPI002810F119|nr:DNA polymerase III subunit delta [Jannaschia sp. LMIT008]